MPAKNQKEKETAKTTPPATAASKKTTPDIVSGVVEIKANLINEDTGSPSNQNLLLILPIEGKKQTKSCPKVWGFLNEYPEGKECRYPFYGEQSKKSGTVVLDLGSALEDDSTSEGRAEKLTQPEGYRYFTLAFSGEISPGNLLTVTGSMKEGERDVYKISSVTEYK